MSNDTLINALKQAREALTETYYFAWDGMGNVVWIDKRHDTIKAIDAALAANTATAPSQPVEQAQIAKFSKCAALTEASQQVNKEHADLRASFAAERKENHE